MITAHFTAVFVLPRNGVPSLQGLQVYTSVSMGLNTLNKSMLFLLIKGADIAISVSWFFLLMQEYGLSCN